MASNLTPQVSLVAVTDGDDNIGPLDSRVTWTPPG